jgi:hypothetical protein
MVGEKKAFALQVPENLQDFPASKIGEAYEVWL